MNPGNDGAVNPGGDGAANPGNDGAANLGGDRVVTVGGEPTRVELQTPHGPARAHVCSLERARAALVLGHGAGGGIAAPDLIAVRNLALGQGVAVALVEQPYRVAGRRSPAPATHLDAAWIAVIAALAHGHLDGLALITGGRSAGARVACRTAKATGAVAVLCLAFPLAPPRRRSSGVEPPSRLDELDSVAVPVLVVQGAADPFGMPPPAPGRRVVAVAGNHSLRGDLPAVTKAVAAWLPQVLDQDRSGRRESNPP